MIVADARQHPLDDIADALFSWMNDEVGYYVDAFKGGYRAPGSAPVTEEQKRDYYRRQMFTANPDGSIDFSKPNGPGRDTLMKSLGVQGYANVFNEVKPKGGLRPPVEPNADPLAPQPEMPPMPEEITPVV